MILYKRIMDFQYNKVTEITGKRVSLKGLVLKYQDQTDEKDQEISLKEAQNLGSLYINTSSDPDHPKWTPVNKISFFTLNSPILEYENKETGTSENKETVKSAVDKKILYIGPTRADLAEFNKARESRLWGRWGGKRNKSRKPKRRNSRSKRRKTLNKSRH